MKFLFVLSIIFFQAIGAIGQVTFIPDTNFRKFLIDKFPTYMDTKGNLINANAATFTGGIDCSQLRVRSLKGIEKFSKLSSLACQFNELGNLDSISNLTSLQFLFCYNNAITYLPDMSRLTKLVVLSSGNNLLKSMPDLGKFTGLVYLDCSNNQLTKLDGLDKLVNLQNLLFLNNQIKNIPSLSGLTKLTSLVCQQNQLEALPGVENCVQLLTLIAGGNPFKITPNVSVLTRLQELKLWDSRISQLPDISKLSALRRLSIDGNYLTSLPDFSAIKVLDTVNIQNNQLTFEDLLPLTQNVAIKGFNYAPQKKNEIDTTITLSESEKFVLSLKFDQNVISNKYLWFKNNNEIKGAILASFQIDKVTQNDTGTYYCQVTNPGLPGLQIFSRSIKLKIPNCINLNNFYYQTTDFDCNSGARIVFNPQTVNGGKAPYKFYLTSKDSGKILLPNGNLFGNLYENSYLLTIQSQDGCKAEKEIVISGNRPDDCNGLVIVADNAANQNALFLNEKGSAKVYDKDGKLVQSFSTPGSWDGKNSQGEFLPGLYIVDLNGKTMRVTLIK
ncbi:MAG: hypothetical protein H7329_07730 [Opitutaceae bacterium]|nr:hypothetical protein [Cytophagales bacterium]